MQALQEQEDVLERSVRPAVSVVDLVSRVAVDGAVRRDRAAGGEADRQDRRLSRVAQVHLAEVAEPVSWQKRNWWSTGLAGQASAAGRLVHLGSLEEEGCWAHRCLWSQWFDRFGFCHGRSGLPGQEVEAVSRDEWVLPDAPEGPVVAEKEVLWVLPVRRVEAVSGLTSAVKSWCSWPKWTFRTNWYRGTDGRSGSVGTSVSGKAGAPGQRQNRTARHCRCVGTRRFVGAIRRRSIRVTWSKRSSGQLGRAGTGGRAGQRGPRP